MNFSLQNNRVILQHEKTTLLFAPQEMHIGEYVIDFPGEFEKDGILVSAEDTQDILLFQVQIGHIRIVYIDAQKFEITEALIELLGDIDVLLIPGNKDWAKLQEGLEAKVVIAYGDGRQTFLTALGQTPEPENKYKLKEADLSGETTHYILLED